MYRSLGLFQHVTAVGVQLFVLRTEVIVYGCALKYALLYAPPFAHLEIIHLQHHAQALYEEDAAIRKKVMKAVTDMGPQTPNSPKPEVIENLFTFLRICSEPETYNYFDEKWNDCSIRYGDLKKQIAEDIIKTVSPIRERIREYSSNTQLLDRIAQEGAEVARASASQTLKEVRQIIGFR